MIKFKFVKDVDYGFCKALVVSVNKERFCFIYPARVRDLLGYNLYRFLG